MVLVAALAAVGLGVVFANRGEPRAVAQEPSRPAESNPPPADDLKDRRARLDQRVAELRARLKQAEAEREVLDLLEARRTGGNVREPFLNLVLTRSAGWSRTVLTIGEYDPLHPVCAEFTGGGMLKNLLVWSRAHPGGPRTLRITVEPEYNAPEVLKEMITACIEAGFDRVTYTGPVPKRFTLGQQDGKTVIVDEETVQLKGAERSLKELFPAEYRNTRHPPSL